MSFRVVQRDKQIEDYNLGKMIRVMEAAGVSKEEATRVGMTITRWIEKSGKPLITTLQIRDRVIIELQKINHEAAKHYIEYEKKKDKTIY